MKADLNQPAKLSISYIIVVHKAFSLECVRERSGSVVECLT